MMKGRAGVFSGRRPTAVFAAAMVAASLSLAAPLPVAAFPGALPRQHHPAGENAAGLRLVACSGRECDRPPPREPGEAPCRPWAPWSHGRSNVGMREMWELITHGAPLPGTDYYYYRMHDHRDGNVVPPRRCRS